MTIYPRGCWTPSQPQSDLAIAKSALPRTRFSFHPARCHSLARLTIALTSSWLATTIAIPVHAASLMNNSGIQFDQDTTLESNFVESHGAYQSTFGVINLDTKEKTPLLIETRASDAPESIFKPSSRQSHLGTNTDFRGTPGNAVSNPVAQYRFKANQRYVLYLESSFNGRPTGIVYSTDVLNPTREQQVQFAGGINDLCSSGITVGWDDTGSKLVRNRQQQDRDFDDFVVQMKSLSCGVGGGEPPSVAVAAPELPSVAPIPSGGGRFNPLWLAPLGLFGLLGSGGGGGGGGGGSTAISPSVPPPAEPIPEPLTILGSGSAIALAALMERRRKKTRK